AAADVREQVADRHSALTVVFELPGATQGAAVIVKLGGFHLHLERLPAFFRQQRLGVERIDLRNASVHVEENDVANFGSKMRRPGRPRGGARISSLCRGTAKSLVTKQTPKGHRAKAGSAMSQHFPPAQRPTPKASTVMIGRGHGAVSSGR